MRRLERPVATSLGGMRRRRRLEAPLITVIKDINTLDTDRVRHARKWKLIPNLKFPILSATKPASGGPMISATGITPLTNAT